MKSGWYGMGLPKNEMLPPSLLGAGGNTHVIHGGFGRSRLKSLQRLRGAGCMRGRKHA